MRTWLLALLLCFLGCSCTRSGGGRPTTGPSMDGPSDLDAANALDKSFDLQKNNPYYTICEGKVEKNVLNKKVEGKEAEVRIEATWKSRMFDCKESRSTFTVNLVNRNGKWEAR